MRPKASADILKQEIRFVCYTMQQRSTRNAWNEIAKLEEVHSNARLIDETHLDLSKVLVLSNVKIKNQSNGMELKYRPCCWKWSRFKTEKYHSYWKGLLKK
jgi:transcription elongation factor GreA